jgi:hypothetical protein
MTFTTCLTAHKKEPVKMRENEFNALQLVEAVLRRLLKRAQSLNPNAATHHEMFVRVELSAEGRFYLHFSSADKALQNEHLAHLMRDAMRTQSGAKQSMESEYYASLRVLDAAFEEGVEL